LPAMGKRANNQAAAKNAKKTKIDPALASVMDAVKSASHLPGQCSTMLSAMLPFSLATASNERADSQQRVVDMAEETLQAVKKEIESLIAADDAKRFETEGKMSELVAVVKGAEALLATQKELVQAKTIALEEATAAAKESAENLTTKSSEKASAEERLTAVQQEKTALEEAFQTHFKVPMEAGEGPHFKELEPFLQSMDLEKSLFTTLPGTCAKNKESRGSFDDVILEQLEKAISTRIVALGDSVSADTALSTEWATTVQQAEADINSKREAQSAVESELESAQKELNGAEAALMKANEAVTVLCPELEGATGKCDASKTKLADFEGGVLATFSLFKTRTAAPVEVAGA